MRDHDFRRTAVTQVWKAKLGQSVIMSISGHKADSAFRYYNRIDLDDCRGAMRKFEIDLLEGKGQKGRNEVYCNTTAAIDNENSSYV